MGAKRYKFKQVVFNSDKELTPNRYFQMPNDAKQIKIQISSVQFCKKSSPNDAKYIKIKIGKLQFSKKLTPNDAKRRQMTPNDVK